MGSLVARLPFGRPWNGLWVTRHWLLVVGYWLLVIGYWLSVSCIFLRSLCVGHARQANEARVLTYTTASARLNVCDQGLSQVQVNNVQQCRLCHAHEAITYTVTAALSINRQGAVLLGPRYVASLRQQFLLAHRQLSHSNEACLTALHAL